MPIQKEQLTFESLGRIDQGRVGKTLLNHLARLAQDCMNRPGCKDKRTVVLEFSAVPVLDQQSGDCKRVDMDFVCKSKMPAYRTETYQFQPSNHGLFFNSDFPEEIDQPSLLGDDD